MLRPTRLIWMIACAWLLLAATRAEAQLFGTPRNLGTPLSRRPQPGAAQPGTVAGGERFVRGNRGPQDFVGAERRDVRRFVGSQRLAGGRVQPATSTLRPQPAPHVNQPLPAGDRGRNSLYEPRLVVDFDFTPRPAHELEQVLAARLANSLANRQWGQIEVSVAGQTATLRGEVVSADARRLAEALVRLEPGIADVQNDLRATSPLPQPAVAESPGDDSANAPQEP